MRALFSLLLQFDIESNVWLTDEEKSELKRREAKALEAEEKRRRQLVVSIDLVGRRVVTTKAGDEHDGYAGEAGEVC